MPKKAPKADAFFRKANSWQDELEVLREILLDCGLSEGLKWGKPCYSYEDNNIAIIQAFKSYFALMFFKGILMKDSKGLLVVFGDHVQSARQMRFKDAEGIRKMEKTIKAYINEAINVEKAGLKVDFKEKNELVFPEEFLKKCDELPALRTAFETLTPGRQREYNLYFTGAKQSKTREQRIEKCMPLIMDGIGLNDDYKMGRK